MASSSAAPVFGLMCSTSPSLELCGRPPCNSYRFISGSISPSPAFVGQLLFASFRPWGCFNEPFAKVRWLPPPAAARARVAFQPAHHWSYLPGPPQQPSLRGYFDQPISGVTWPASLQQLSFGEKLDQPIVGAVWPTSLQQLEFGYYFNQPIVGVVWPTSLQQLSFGEKCNQPVVGVVWPASLKPVVVQMHVLYADVPATSSPGCAAGIFTSFDRWTMSIL